MEPVTRKEIYLAKAGGQEVETPTPVTHEEMYLAKMAGQEVEVPTPVTREDVFYKAIIDNMGGSSDAEENNE